MQFSVRQFSFNSNEKRQRVSDWQVPRMRIRVQLTYRKYDRCAGVRQDGFEWRMCTDGYSLKERVNVCAQN